MGLGRLAKCSFTLNGNPVKLVNNFKYLGFIFSSRLSFTEHIKGLIATLHWKIGLLNARIPLKRLPLKTVLKLFDVYILPCFSYGNSFWISKTIKNSENAVNAVFTKFLKRYLGIPNHCRNSIVHHITETKPLFLKLKDTAIRNLESISFPDELSGHMLSFVKSLYQFNTNYNALNDIPTYFWRSRALHNLPLNPKMRRSVCIEILDLDHHTYCINKGFHTEFKEGCVCVACLKPIFAYHKYACKPQNQTVMITPIKFPDNWFQKYSYKPKHPQVVLTPLKLPDNWFHVTKIPPKDIQNEVRKKKKEEENNTLNFLEIRRKSKRTVKINSKFTGDDWINKWYFYIHFIYQTDIECIAWNINKYGDVEGL